MYKVVRLELKGNRWHVFLDNDVNFLLYKGELKRLKLQEDSYINENQYETIIEILYKRARERALYLLDDAYKTKKQIVDKLKSGLYPEFVIDRVVEYLLKYDLVNDFRYATLYIDYKRSSKSRRKIIQDLHSKGIEKSIIDAAFEEVEFSDKDSLKKVIDKRISRYSLNERKDVEKLYRYLLGKGYHYEDVKNALSQYSF